ncbi:uncharacterized protein Triagg1_1759 [Trichoderma aggressivum f. europaeum]|uniref:Uncharacterized protein n=1 Tax=Trichoderma aggressivum f. europaeum TaxID=173218 RepID=A0AAE1IIX1_9HYPO|nr:hypothetical protein Triagg1_1759 [Trichoderma aggressivum f. europaeum]
MANLRASFMFNRDFENAFLHVVKSFIRTNVEDVRAQNVVRFFIYPSVELGEQLRKYGCWCDGARTSPHGYEDCDKIKGLPYPSIIGEDPNDRGKRKVSQLRICPDMDDEVPKHRKDHHHRLGCFIPVESAEKFMVWFQEHGVRDYSGNSELWDERLAARYFVDDYIRRMSIFETGELDRNDKENMVLSLLLSFQGKDIKDDARKSPVAWEAERLLKFLEWNEHDFKLGMKELREAMEEKNTEGKNGSGGRPERKNRRGCRPEGNIRRGGASLQKNHTSRENRRGGPIVQKNDIVTESRRGDAILQKTNTTGMRDSGRILQRGGRGGALQGNDMKESIGGPVPQERDLEGKMGGGGILFQKNNLEEDMSPGRSVLEEEDMSPGRLILPDENLRGGRPILQ